MASFSRTANKHDGYKSMLHQPDILTTINHLKKKDKTLEFAGHVSDKHCRFLFDFSLAAMKIWLYYLDCALILFIF